MKYQKKVTGERIFLSPMNISDLEMYYKWFNSSDVTDGLGDTYFQNTLESEREWLEDNLKKQTYNFAIVRLEDEKLLGGAGFAEINQIHRRATVGIYIGEEENRGKGYGTEALRLMLEFGFGVLNFNNIKLDVFDFNIRAAGSYIKAGFTKTGRRRQAYYLNNKYHDIIEMDILREEWYKAKS